MFYKLTLLKDLPKYPAGTQFSYRFGQWHYERNDIHEVDVNTFGKMGLYGSDKMSSLFPIPEEIIDDPEWIRKEVDYSKIVDLACPVCGESRVDMSVDYPLIKSQGILLKVEYACGHAGGKFGRLFEVKDFATDCGEATTL